jgi:hypothetical protein
MQHRPEDPDYRTWRDRLWGGPGDDWAEVDKLDRPHSIETIARCSEDWP